LLDKQVMPVQPPPFTGGTRQQELQYYASVLNSLPGTYQGNAAQYRGMKWGQMYLTLAAQEPGIDAKVLADDVLGVEAAQGFATGVGATAGATGTFINAAGSAGAGIGNTAVGHAVGGAENALGAITDITGFLSRLTSANLWLRVGEFVLGALLILSGAMTLAGKNGDISAIVKTGIKYVK
jgi:hypothetical protein